MAVLSGAVQRVAVQKPARHLDNVIVLNSICNFNGQKKTEFLKIVKAVKDALAVYKRVFSILGPKNFKYCRAEEFRGGLGR